MFTTLAVLLALCLARFAITQNAAASQEQPVANIVFFSQHDDCDLAKREFVACQNLPESTCCRSNGGFCSLVLLDNTPEGNHLDAFEGAHCNSSEQHTTCQQTLATNRCCIGVPDGYDVFTCSAKWAYGGGSSDGSAASSTNNCARPDRMAYFDAGAQQLREIHLPDGAFDDAVRHYQAKNYSALARYSAWTG